jgi:hypothetical protein
MWHELTRKALGIAITAIGNRQWGAGPMPTDKIKWPLWLYSKWLAALLMTVGITLTNPTSYATHDLATWWHTLAIYALVVGFRIWGTGETFLALESRTGALLGSIVRAAEILPLAALLAYLDYLVTGHVGVWHVVSFFGFPFLAFTYWVAGKAWPVKATEIAESLDGAYIALMGASQS